MKFSSASDRGLGACFRHGFTLIELLTVLVIISVLAVLTFSVLKSSRQNAKQVQSVANLRLIGAALISYTGENDGRYPLGATSDFKGPFWSDAIEPYLPDEVEGGWINSAGKTYKLSPVLVDPLVEDGFHHQITDYGANREVLVRNDGGNPLAVSAVLRPANTIAVVAGEISKASGVIASWHVETYRFISSPDSNSFAKPSDRGTRRVNAVFCDGHVESIPWEKFVENRESYLLINPTK